MKNLSLSHIIKEVRTILINENKNTSIIVDKIGLPSDIADWIINNYNDKFQLWVANNFRDEAIKRISGDKSTIAFYMLKMLRGDKTQPSLRNQLLRQKGHLDGQFRHITQWLTGRRQIAPETDEVNLKTLTFEEAVRRADAWHDAVQRLRTGTIVDETGKIVKVFPTGFYWINLQRSFCSDESRAMGHCGNATGILYSLRKDKHPYLTADVHRNNLIQLRGRANTKPKAEYHPYIMEFLLDDTVGIRSMNPSSYKPEHNFELKDLSLTDLEKLYAAKPTLFVPEELYKAILKHPALANKINFRATPIYDENKEDLARRFPDIAHLFGR